MSILNIVKFPNKVLNKKTNKVKKITNNTLNDITNMIETMYYFNGIGLASTQVNIKESIIIVNITTKERALILINPRIIKSSNTYITTKEGCLSFPNIFISIKRSSNIYITFKDIKNKTHNIHCDNLLSICVQHEIDHINGITIYDKLSKLKKNMYFSKNKK